jgi:hypothetical protein
MVGPVLFSPAFYIKVAWVVAWVVTAQPRPSAWVLPADDPLHLLGWHLSLPTQQLNDDDGTSRLMAPHLHSQPARLHRCCLL